MFAWLREKLSGPDFPTQKLDGAEMGFPFALIKTPGSRALEVRRQYLGSADVTPIVLGAPDGLSSLLDGIEDDHRDPREIIDQSTTSLLASWQTDTAAAFPEYASFRARSRIEGSEAAEQLTVHLNRLTHLPLKEVLVGLVPTGRSWEVPAFLKLGGWNECPIAEVHVALHRCWNETFGAEIACVSSDILECTVSRPPSSVAEATELAIQQALYCPDLIGQGVGSMESLISLLLGARSWHFWWD